MKKMGRKSHLPVEWPTSDHRYSQRLELCDVPKEMLDHLQSGLVAFTKENKSLLPKLVSAILPNDEDVHEALQAAKIKSRGSLKGPSMKEQFRESFVWLQWLMFEEEPRAFLKSLGKGGFGQRGLCGAVLRRNNIAYRCRTCENDPTCVICVSCFQNGNHKDHDYSIVQASGGGCCDCGDVTAWKREGFCSKHRGLEQIQRLPEEIASSVGPVIDALLVCWKEKLLSAKAAAKAKPRDGDYYIRAMAANELSLAAIEMLLGFSKHSESLLCFVSKQMLLSIGFLDVLVKAEWFLSEVVAKKLLELILKLLGEPVFKYEFAKVFINCYTVIINEAIKECSDTVLKKYPPLVTFSVQIFTVSTLTPRLVRELDLLNVMLGCLSDLFLSCVSEEGYLQVSRWASLYETTLRLVEDIHYIMSHVEVLKYVIQEMPDISRTWMEVLTLVQGMDPQKRVTGLHLEEENENMHAPFVLGNSIGNIHSLLVTGAFSLDDAEEIMQDLDDGDRRHAKVGRLSEEISISSMTGRSSSLSHISQVTDINFGTSRPSVPWPVTWLIFECLKAIENWLGHDAAIKKLLDSSSPGTNSNTHYNTSTLRKSLLKIRKGRNVTRGYLTTSMPEGDTSRSRLTGSVEFHGRLGSSLAVYGGFRMNAKSEGEGSAAPPQDNNPMDVDDLEFENCSSLGDLYDSTVKTDCAMEVDTLGVLSLKEWPAIAYDVSLQEISFHIPLHRLLSQLLQKALRRSCGDPGLTEMKNGIPTGPLPACYHNFFEQVLEGFHPLGFSAFVMEHPLRLRVFCAQVHAGMWQKNGDAVILSCQSYRCAHWWKQGLEFDLFLLQCCAALAPPDLFVKRILERFGLLDYLSLNLEQSNKYEPVLVQEMFTLIIQIVKERQFCGLSTDENLRRELVYKLSVGDATHSELVKALPHNFCKSDQLQKTVDMLAENSNPSGMKQGRYSLRKEYWKELDLYHPRWNSRDLQVAEERYLRFCKVSALTVQLPQWTKVFYPLNSLSRIATSKAVLQLVRTVLFYAVFTDKYSLSRAPDGVLLTALHLLSLALDICYVHKQTGVAKYGGDQSCSSTSSVDEDLFPLLTYASEEIDVGATNGPDEWKQQSMLTLLVSLMRKFKKENEHSLMEASPRNFSSLIEILLKKFGELDAGCMTKLQPFAPDVVRRLSQMSLVDTAKISAPPSDAEE